ncbi:ThiF family adenylyltransferase [Corallococcus sp. AS-1-12]|uniref:ThiF family adenylyltransferase n=1 Tax=Corallococcus sp. AS-1-12 TaxID=2874598 RepID=UPI001CBBA45F|nr:ThiF family adenylyltransferase [Corallococcus sp. AS-1-12]MBZ4333830.1 ThiF family adenylyltransferase [Corallococcus sp. AS-1-12]
MSAAIIAQQEMHIRVLQQLAHSGLLEDCGRPICLPEKWSGTRTEATCTGKMTVEGQTFWLRVRLPWEFPLCLPIVSVEKTDSEAALPHFTNDDEVCFASDVGLLDRRRPDAILHESIERVRALLRDMLRGDRGGEFLREIQAYWFGISSGHRIDCTVTADNRPRFISALYRGTELQALADDADSYAHSLPDRRAGGLIAKKALYLPLSPGDGNPSFLPKELTTPEGLRKYVRRMPDGIQGALAGLLRRFDVSEHLVVLGLKRPQGERAVVGVHLKGLEHGHPLLQDRTGAQVEPIALMRRDPDYLLPRGGAEHGLRERRVLIAGCGSVGGHIALALARAGVGGLTLVDPDLFMPENTFRHVCGMRWPSTLKVTGLKKEIESRTPYVSVQPIAGWLEKLLQDEPGIVRGHDLVIAALGQPTLELHLNEWAWSNAEHPPALFTWLEPYGLGGHALLTHVRGKDARQRGCLECLYDRDLGNRAAFADPRGTYTQDVLGCGSRFMPFADLDAQRTAELATRLALRALRQEAHEAPLLSWKGDARQFRQKGFTVTPRYEQEPDKLEATWLDYRRDDCLICAPGPTS